MHGLLRIPLFLLGLYFLLVCRAAEPITPAAFDAAFGRIGARPGVTDETVQFRELVGLWWRYQMVGNPEFATYVGNPGLNDRWTDISRPALNRQNAEIKRTDAALARIDRAALPPTEQLYFDLFLRTVRLSEEGGRFPEELLAVTQMSGPQ